MENQKKEVWLRKALFLIVSLALFFPMMAQTITVKGVVKGKQLLSHILKEK